MAVKEKKEKSSRVEKLWEAVGRDYADTIGLDLSYIDKLTIDERIKDEFVRLPYDAPRVREECNW